MPPLLIRNASLVVAEPGIHLSSVDILVEEGIIADIGRGLSSDGSMVIEARGLIVTPGLASGHTHLSLYPLRTIYRGMRLDEWVARVLGPWEPYISGEDSYNASLLAAYRLLENGVTFAADMHFNMLDVARAVSRAGLRADLSVAIMERGTRKDFKELLEENIRLYEEMQGHPLITVSFAPCTIRLLDAENLAEIFHEARARKTRIHIHLSEVPEDEAYARRISGMRPAMYLDQVAGLGRDTVLAHGTHLSFEELVLVSRRGANIVHNPSSNAMLGSGIAPYREMLELGINVALGVDVSPDYSVSREAAVALGLSALRGRPASFIDVYRSATFGGYTAYGLKGGLIRRGFLADLVLWKMRSPLASPPEEAIVTGQAIPETVIVGGKQVVEGGRVSTISLEEAARASRSLERKLHSLYQGLDAGHRFYSKGG